MDLRIFCPNCHSQCCKISFSEVKDTRELFCNSCNLAFTLILDESSSRKNKEHDDLVFKLLIGPEKQRLWTDADQNLMPVFKCVLCEQKIKLNWRGDSESLIECNRCGAGYYLDLDFLPDTLDR